MKNEQDSNQPQQPEYRQPEPPTTTPTPAPTAPMTPTTTASKGLAIAAMVVGIISVIIGMIPIVGLIFGVAAIVLGIIALKRKSNKGMSIAGIVTGGVATIWNLIVSILMIITFLTVASVGNNILDTLQSNRSDYNASEQAKIDATKDFAKGTTAIFDNFEVKINSVQRNFIPESSYLEASEGNELIVLNISVTNIGDELDGYISSYDFQVKDNANINTTTIAGVDNAYNGAMSTLSTNQTSTGNLVFEVTKNATNLKLQYETTAYSEADSDYVTLTYSLSF